MQKQSQFVYTDAERADRISFLAFCYKNDCDAITRLKVSLRRARSDRSRASINWQIKSARYQQHFLVLERRYLRGVSDAVLFERSAGIRVTHCTACGVAFREVFYRDRGNIVVAANGGQFAFCLALECREAAREWLDRAEYNAWSERIDASLDQQEYAEACEESFDDCAYHAGMRGHRECECAAQNKIAA